MTGQPVGLYGIEPITSDLIMHTTEIMPKQQYSSNTKSAIPLTSGKQEDELRMPQEKNAQSRDLSNSNSIKEISDFRCIPVQDMSKETNSGMRTSKRQHSVLID